MISSILPLMIVMMFAMMSPGPDMFLLIKNAMGRERRVAFGSVLGICLGLSIHIFLWIFGLAVILQQNIFVYNIIRWLGAFYLIYLGMMAIFFTGNTLKIGSGSLIRKTLAQGFKEGLFCNLLNPKVTLFILSLFTQLIDPGIEFTHKLIFGAIIIFQCFIVWSLFISIIQSRPVQGFLARYSLVIERLCGLVFIGLGIKIFVT